MSALEFEKNLMGMKQSLFYFALSLTRNGDDAKDLLQDCMLRALTYRDKFRENTNFKAWLYTIMRNTFINGHRRTKRTRNVMSSVEQERTRVRSVQVPDSPERSMGEMEIMAAIDQLDPAFSEPFTMHYEGFKYNEIAEHLDVPIGTVKSRIFQARKRLMKMLEGNRF